MATDSYEKVKEQVREVGNKLKDAYTFKKQREQASDWWNEKVSQAKSLVGKYAPSKASAAERAPEKKVSAKTTTTVRKGPARKKATRKATTKR